MLSKKSMDHLLNLQAVKKKMKKKPATNQLYTFFYGRAESFNQEQIKDVKKIVTASYKELMEFLDEAIQENKKESA